MMSNSGNEISFSLTAGLKKTDLSEYAKKRGFLNLSAMARHAFYCYLAKCHYSFPEAGETPDGSIIEKTGEAAL